MSRTDQFELRQQIAAAFADGLGDAPALSSSTAPALLREARDAGRRFIAVHRWAELTGDRIDTATARKLLGVSRQALNRRVAAGTLIALPGQGTSWYPTWQLGADTNGVVRVRPVVARIVGAFRDELGDAVSPFELVAWAATPQPELAGETPQAWLRGDGDDDPVVAAAQRAAAALAH